MRKRVLIGLLLIICLFMVVGCKREDKEDSDGLEKLDKNGNVILYSDDKKMVFEKGASLMAYYYEGDKITAYYAYIDYGDNKTAKIALRSLKEGNDPNIKSLTVKGKYIVVEYGEAMYSSFTTDDIKQENSYLNEVKRK